jgi:hypothetical protein
VRYLDGMIDFGSGGFMAGIGMAMWINGVLTIRRERENPPKHDFPTGQVMKWVGIVGTCIGLLTAAWDIYKAG